MSILEKREERGIQKGMQKGEIKKAKEIARNLLKEGAEIALVVKATGLSKDEVINLKE